MEAQQIHTYAASEVSGHVIADHFPGVGNMIGSGSDSLRQQQIRSR